MVITSDSKPENRSSIPRTFANKEESDLYLISPQHLSSIVQMIEDGTITRNTARDVMDFYILLGRLRRIRERE